MIGMDDSKSNRDIVEMIKKIALAIEKKNTQDLRNIAEELESWEPRGNWDDMDVRTKVFVEHLLVGLARIQLGLDVLDKGANELTEIRQEVEEKEMNDAILDSFDDEDYAGFDFVCFKCGLRKIGKAELEDSVGNKMCGRCARALGGKNTSDLMTKLDELKRENVDLAQKITTENLDRFCKRDLDNVDEDEKFTCERCGILKRKSAPAVSNYRDVDGHKICARCYRGFKHWMERVKDCKKPDFLQRPSRKNKKSKNLKEYWDKREAYRDEIFRKLEEMKRNQKREYVDEAEWWLDKRYGTDKQHCDKKDLTDDEKEDLK